jgi:hypothetical protein
MRRQFGRQSLPIFQGELQVAKTHETLIWNRIPHDAWESYTLTVALISAPATFDNIETFELHVHVILSILSHTKRIKTRRVVALHAR